jgi:Pvc16 N-terminal domain
MLFFTLFWWCSHTAQTFIAMLNQALKYIATQVNTFFDNPATPAVEAFVSIGNIAKLESGSDAGNADLRSQVVLTLINIEEEKALKNGTFLHRTTNADGTVAVGKRNPTLHLNLYLLFSCASDDYETALRKIGMVISFFQEHYVFPFEKDKVPLPEDIERIVLDIHTLNFEQINHLWGILGGKYLPSVVYRARLVEVQNKNPKGMDIVKALREDVGG